MNRRMVILTVGKILMIEALLMLLPLAVSLIYMDTSSLWSFAISIGATLLFAFLLMLIGKTKDSIIFAKEGFVIVAFSWLLMSIFGALPFVISGEIPSFIDAFFETVSGFTTTGASILRNVEAMSRPMLFWRSFTHWIGGMGVIVFVMAIIPSTTDRSIHIMRAEVPGPVVGKLVPKVRETAKILYLIYIALTLVLIILLLLGKMPLFDSLIHAFGTAGTGGFGIKADGITSYSPYLQWVLAIFMLLFGTNFNLYYLILLRRIRSVLKSEELWCYIGIVAASVAMIAGNVHTMYDSFSETLRASFFQVSSIITTTGFATTDFNTWPVLSKSILLILMFIGACAGSTGGGFKVSRLVILFKTIKGNLKKMLHPRATNSVRFEGKGIENDTVMGVLNYLAVYIGIFFLLFLAVCACGKFDIETNFSACAACYNNIGPAFGAAGPMSSYADYDIISKLLLSFSMLFGRLELFPMIFLFSPKLWSKKS